MKINSLRFQDTFQSWGFEKINFFNLTLLVGISGVGKTQILKGILGVKDIASGKSLNGIKWHIEFETFNQSNYKWEGEFEKLENKSFVHYLRNEEDNKLKPKILIEKLFLNNDLIVEKKDGTIYFESKKMPKLSFEKSLISIFKEEEKIKPAYNAFKKIVFRDHTNKEEILELYSLIDINLLKQKYKTLKEIQESDLDTNIKLACVYDNLPDIFAKIKDSFISIFEQVEDVKIAPIEDNNLPSFYLDEPILQIKEKGIWISQNRISSGMLRTFLHISEMLLWSKGTVILIDEFENSLGVNCIDILTEDLIFENDQIQFIATSHHPYIINKIPYEYWKIINRKGGQISTYDAKDFKLGDSRHERFMNLINLPKYQEGIATN